MKGDNALTRLAIGSIFVIFGVLLIPLVLVHGYFVRVAHSISNGESVPPDFDNWYSLFVDGLRLLAVLFVYFVAPFVLVVVGVTAVFAVPSIPYVGLDPLLVRRIFIALGGVGLGLFLLCGYVAPAAVVNFARTGRMRSAFALRRIWPVLKTGSYATAWVLALGIMITANAVIGVLAITVVGSLVGALVYFYASIVSTHLYTIGFQRIHHIESV